MSCATARRLVSDRIDAPLPAADDAALEAHVATCAACGAFVDRLEAVRRHLHLQPVVATPDVSADVRAAIERRQRRTPSRRPRRRGTPNSPVPAAAAAFVAAFALAAALVGFPGPRDAGAIDVASLVVEGQSALHTLEADVEVTEHGWHPDVSTRRYTGTLTYVAPETLQLVLEDRTDYPDAEWLPNDVTFVVDGPRAWGVGRAPCPTAGLPACIPAQTARAIDGREPFDPVEPVPLDLVLPVASFAIGGAERQLGERVIDDRGAVGVEVTAAQIGPLLDGIQRYGNWRPIHPTDVAATWLDARLGVPLAVEIRAGSGPERERWAAANGLSDAPGAPLLSWRLHGLDVNDGVSPPAGDGPDVVAVTDRGFRDGEVTGPTPGWLPDGMELHRAGRSRSTTVTSYSDGRAWVAIRATTAWQGTRLFGQPSSVVRRVALAGAGIGYVAEGGDRVLLHGDGIDVEVLGSLPTAELLRVAAGLGVHGLPVPEDWSEASTTSLDDASELLPGLLTVPPSLDGYAGPGVAASPDGVMQSFTGAGDRAFTLSQVPGERLGPPMDALVLAVEVRDRRARYTPDRGTLEWIEDRHVVTLRSRTLDVGELSAIAASLEVAE